MVIPGDGRASIIINSKNKFQNDSSSADAQFALQVNQWLLKPLGIWPVKKHSSFFEKIITATVIIVCSILLAFVFVPGLFLLINVKSFTARLNLLTGPFSFYVMSLMKYHSLVSGQQNLSNCIEKIIADWRELNSVNDRNIMIDYAKYGRFGAVICAIFMYGGGIFYAGILPRISGNIENINNETIRPLAYPGYYGFFNPQLSPAYEIVYGIHCCCAFVMHSITSATCSLLVVFAMHACGQLEIIMVWLNNLVNETENNNEHSNEGFSKIIQQHVKTLRFINNIEKVLCEICLVEVVGCTLNICVIGYNLLLQWGKSDAIGIITFTTLLISFIFNIFLLCYIGELLAEKCKKVGETAYMIDWYCLPGRKALGLTLAISTAQNPVIITAGKIINLSLTNFCSVMRTSVTYLNLLRTFME